MNNSDIVGGTLKIGSGTSVFKADTLGVYLGSETFAYAPFSVTPEGKLTAKNASIQGDTVMKSGSISWENIGKPSYSAYEVGARTADWKPTPAEINAVYNSQAAVFNTLTNNGATRGLFMENGALYVNADYIKTGSLSADLIKTGYLSADRISSGSITSSTINVNTDVRIGKTLYLSPDTAYNGGGIIWTGTAYQIYIDPISSALHLRTPQGGGVWADGIRVDRNAVAVFG